MIEVYLCIEQENNWRFDRYNGQQVGKDTRRPLGHGDAIFCYFAARVAQNLATRLTALPPYVRKITVVVHDLTS
jgi:hypothetical protein